MENFREWKFSSVKNFSANFFISIPLRKCLRMMLKLQIEINKLFVFIFEEVKKHQTEFYD